MELTASDESLLQRFDRIGVHRRGDTRSVHKPLLLLLALSSVEQRRSRWLRYVETSRRMTELLARFGAPSKSTRPDLPYRRLANDGIWELPALPTLKSQANKRGVITAASLKEIDAEAGFTDEIFRLLDARPDLVRQIALRVAERNFPESKRREVLDAVGL